MWDVMWPSKNGKRTALMRQRELFWDTMNIWLDTQKWETLWDTVSMICNETWWMWGVIGFNKNCKRRALRQRKLSWDTVNVWHDIWNCETLWDTVSIICIETQWMWDVIGPGENGKRRALMRQREL